MESCSGVPGIVYNFYSKNLVTFEDNFSAKGDLPMAIYFDYETTAILINYFDPEQNKRFVFSYVLIVAFHPHLNIRKIVVQRSYGHSLEQLNIIDYLSEDQMKHIDVKLVKQLNHVAQMVRKKKSKNALRQMFSIETAFVKKTLLQWFDIKIKSQNLEIDLKMKNQFERKNPINWQTDKCVECKCLLKIDPLDPHVPNHSMSYGDFFIRYEHKFLRSIYSNKETAESPQMCTLEKYYEAYQKLVKICVGQLPLTSNYVHSNQGDLFDTNVRDFLDEKHPDEVEIKNLIKETVGLQKNLNFN